MGGGVAGSRFVLRGRRLSIEDHLSDSQCENARLFRVDVTAPALGIV
jgi:hypothetical protein